MKRIRRASLLFALLLPAMPTIAATLQLQSTWIVIRVTDPDLDFANTFQHAPISSLDLGVFGFASATDPRAQTDDVLAGMRLGPPRMHTSYAWTSTDRVTSWLPWNAQSSVPAAAWMFGTGTTGSAANIRNTTDAVPLQQ